MKELYWQEDRSLSYDNDFKNQTLRFEMFRLREVIYNTVKDQDRFLYRARDKCSKLLTLFKFCDSRQAYIFNSSTIPKIGINPNTSSK